MSTEMITLKLDDKFLEEVDDAVKKGGYHSRTEFIRNALREQVNKAKMKKAFMEIIRLKGKSKKKISNDDYESVRKRAFEELGREFR